MAPFLALPTRSWAAFRALGPIAAAEAARSTTRLARRRAFSAAFSVATVAEGIARSPAGLQLSLTAEQRTVLRGRRQTPCGREVLLQLPRDGALRPGDRLTDAVGSVQVEVIAAPEALMRVEADSALELLQAAYHLGNRHVALELHEHELLLPQDPVLEALLQQRGLVLSHCQRPFLPEGGAYGRHSHP